MAGLMQGMAVAEELATAGCGALNAAYFASRAWRSRGARRVASGVLALLFAGSALASSQPSDPGLLDVVLRAPLLGANVAALVLLWMGAGR